MFLLDMFLQVIISLVWLSRAMGAWKGTNTLVDFINVFISVPLSEEAYMSR